MNKTILISMSPGLVPPSNLPKVLSSFKKFDVLLVAPEASAQTCALAGGHVRLSQESSVILAARKESKGDAIFFLSPFAKPEAGWARGLEKALGSNDIALGKVEYDGGKLPFDRAVATLFKGRTERTARGLGYTFPWGSFSNMGVKRDWLEKVGELALAAGPAAEMDWCWRALFAGAVMDHAPEAVVTLTRRQSREAWLQEFEDLGRGEAWVQSAYLFLHEAGEIPPVTVAAEAYLRIRRYSAAAKLMAIAEPLEEIAVAYACGIRLGWEKEAEAPAAAARTLPKRAIGWWSSKKDLTVFVPGKGVTNLAGPAAQLFLAWRSGAAAPQLTALYRKLFKVDGHEAEHGVEELLTALRPAGPTVWVKI